ncbi:hypothetical protein ACP70R_021219 [Stipagrostis hirtigluma subsp. patula]
MMKAKPSVEIVQHAPPARAGGPKVIIIGAGMSGISAGKQLSDAGITDLLILEATDRIGGRIRKTEFAGMNVEIGANWVEGVADSTEIKDKVNPIWRIVNDELNLNTCRSDYSHLAGNTYKEDGTGLYDEGFVQKSIKVANELQQDGNNLSQRLMYDDISVMAMQRLFGHTLYGPTKPVDMVVDYYMNDYEFAEPPRVTSLQNTHPLPTFQDFGDDVYFVADQRGFESVVHYIAGQYLETDDRGAIVDQRVILKKVVKEIHNLQHGVKVRTEDGWWYEADYVMVSVSLGVLQSNLIKFFPPLPDWKTFALCQFDMAVYTKIFLKFPKKFWPVGSDTEFFLYASSRRGYYPLWQHLEKVYPESNILLVTVTDDESRRIEQQSNEQTKAEAMEVLRKMFPDRDVPDATDIFVPRWWSDRFYRGSFSNWPIGVNRYEYDLIRVPVERVYFTGEHTSTRYNGYVHGAYLAARSPQIYCNGSTGVEIGLPQASTAHGRPMSDGSRASPDSPMRASGPTLGPHVPCASHPTSRAGAPPLHSGRAPPLLPALVLLACPAPVKPPPPASPLATAPRPAPHAARRLRLRAAGPPRVPGRAAAGLAARPPTAAAPPARGPSPAWVSHRRGSHGGAGTARTRTGAAAAA